MAAVFYLLTPAMWTGVIDDLLKSQNDWQVEFDSISGHLLTNARIANLRISNSDSTQILVTPELLFNINPIPWLFREYSFRKVVINDFELTFHGDSIADSLNILSDRSSQLLQTDIYIKKLVLNGDINLLTGPDIDRSIDLAFTGRFRYRSDGSFIYINQFSYWDNQQLDLRISNSGLQIFPEELIVKSLAGEINNQSFVLDLKGALKPAPYFEGELTVNDLQVPIDSSAWNLIKPTWRVIDTKLIFETDLVQHTGELLISTTSDTVRSEFIVTSQTGNYQLKSIRLEIDSTYIDGQGIFEKDQRISGRLNLSKLNLNQFLTKAPTTQLSGMVLIETTIDTSYNQHALISLELLEQALIPDEDITLSGVVVYQDDLLTIDNPLMITNNIGTVAISGLLGIDDYQADLKINMVDANLALIEKILGKLSASGLVTGEISINDSISNPRILADVNFVDFDLYDIQINRLDMYADLKGPWNLQQGNVTFSLQEGTWKRYHADIGSIELAIGNQLITITSLHIKDGENFLQITGELDPTGKIRFDQLRMGYNLHYFVTAKPFEVSWKKKFLDIKPFTIHVDDGIMEGFVNISDYREGRIKFSNFNSSAIIEHIPDGFLGLSGLLFGEVALFGDQGDESVEIELSMKNGTIINQSFDDLVVSTVWHENILHFDEFTLTKGSDVGIQFSGVLPLKDKLSSTVIIGLLAELRNVEFGIVRQFIPDFTYLGGDISGEIDLSGTTSDLRFSYDLKVNDAVYDIVPLGQLASKGDYSGERVNFYSFESKYRGNEIKGSGSLPVDLNLASDKFGKFVNGDSLFLEVTAKTGDMEFLSGYLDAADSLTGNLDIGLSLSGVPEKIIRNGWLNVVDGSIYTILLDNTIEDISGAIEITDNMMHINRFNATLPPSPEFNRRISIRAALTGRTRAIDSNLEISGSMDMTKFFKPRYDLHLIADNAYVRTLLGDIEGLVDVDLTMTGQDTITYSGTIAPINVEMKQEFVTSDIDESTYERDEIISEYKITFPITGDFKLINTQLDADLIGELSLTQFGDQESDYSGELFIQGGKFYYTGDIFNIVDGSSLVFNRRGFNPDLDIEAYTDIDIYRITVTLTGGLDNPTLMFDSDPFLSQTDILSLLTLRTRLQDDEFASGGFGQLSGSIVGAWFEQQLEKNLSQVTRQLGIIDEVNITGTSGLIDDTNTDDLEISAQRQLSSKLALNYSYKRSFGLSNNLVGVEYKLNRYLSLVGNYDEEGKLQVKYRLRYSY